MIRCENGKKSKINKAKPVFSGKFSVEPFLIGNTSFFFKNLHTKREGEREREYFLILVAFSRITYFTNLNKNYYFLIFFVIFFNCFCQILLKFSINTSTHKQPDFCNLKKTKGDQ